MAALCCAGTPVSCAPLLPLKRSTAACPSTGTLHVAAVSTCRACPQVVPTKEEMVFAIRSYSLPQREAATPNNIIYMDLDTGNIIYATSELDYAKQLSYYNYTVLLPNVVDLTQYRYRLIKWTPECCLPAGVHACMLAASSQRGAAVKREAGAGMQQQQQVLVNAVPHSLPRSC